MNPVLGTAVLLLVALMSTSVSARSLTAACRKNPVKPCRGKAGWFQLGKTHCVRAFLRPKLTFHQAEKTCRRVKNGNLVSIHSRSELLQVLCTMLKVYIGKYHYWIGLKKVNNSFRWTDGSRGRYRNFARGQPDNYMWREKCVEINYWQWGLWNDEACWAKRPYVCAVKL